MKDNLVVYKELQKLFEKNGFSLFCVGGTVRDYLLKKELTDMDLATNAKPNDISNFLNDADYTFSKYGSVKYIYKGVKFDITTFRKEYKYTDSRHPNNIKFVSSPKKEFKRRDLSINALYMDQNLKIIDYVHGQKDIENKIIKLIGNPTKRIKEDPLRIIRIARFCVDLDFSIDKKTLDACKSNASLLNKINKSKIEQDIHKIKCTDKNKILKVFNDINIAKYLSVIK